VDASEEIPLNFPAKRRGAAGGSLEDIFRLQYPRLVSLLTRITEDRGQAEELASEVFCRLSSRPALFRPESNLDGWLYRTAVNLGLDALRMEARRRRNEQAAGGEVARNSSGGDPLADMLRSEQRTRVQAVLAALKPVSARLLLMRHAGFSYGELAGALAIQPGSVGTLLARAAAEFEKKYRSLYGGELRDAWMKGRYRRTWITNCRKRGCAAPPVTWRLARLAATGWGGLRQPSGE